MQKLPTGERMQKRGGCEDERCSSCGELLESDDHLFQCPKRPQFRRRLLGTIDKIGPELDPMLYKIMKDGITKFLDGPNIRARSQCINITDDPMSQLQMKRKQTELYANNYHEYSELVQSQQSIGWNNFLRGKLSNQWRIFQRRYEIKNKFDLRQKQKQKNFCTNPYDKKQSLALKKKQKGNVFQRLISKLFLLAKDEMWRQRNLDRHNPKNKTNYSAVIKVDRQIKELYGLRDQVCVDDIDTCYKMSMDDLITSETITKQNWVQRWRNTIMSSVKRAKRDDTGNVTKIWQHFGLTTRPTKTVDRRNINQQKQRFQRSKQNARAEKPINRHSGFTLGQTVRSTSIKGTVKEPKQYEQKRIDDRYGDGWND